MVSNILQNEVKSLKSISLPLIGGQRKLSHQETVFHANTKQPVKIKSPFKEPIKKVFELT